MKTYLLTSILFLLLYGCSKDHEIKPEKLSSDIETAVDNTVDTAIMNLLFNEYNISYEKSLEAISSDKTPKQFTKDSKTYLDWMLLTAYILKQENDDNENLRNAFEKKKLNIRRLPFVNDARLPAYPLDPRSPASPPALKPKVITPVSNIALALNADGSIGILMNGDPIVLPEVVITAPAYHNDFGGRGGPSFNAAYARARALENLAEQINTAIRAFEQTAQQDEGNRPDALKAADIINCFNDGKTASKYELTLYVDQPKAGSSASIDLTNGNVGHSFIGLTKFNTDGSIVEKVFGFYPGDGKKDVVLSDGTLRDNQVHSYDVSITRTFTDQTTFNLIAGKIKEYDNKKYILYGRRIGNIFIQSSNCTDAAISIAISGGITVPTGYGNYFGPFLPGNSPGRFGQNLRNQAKENPSDMLGRKTQRYDTNGGIAPENKGCN